MFHWIPAQILQRFFGENSRSYWRMNPEERSLLLLLFYMIIQLINCSCMKLVEVFYIALCSRLSFPCCIFWQVICYGLWELRNKLSSTCQLGECNEGLLSWNPKDQLRPRSSKKKRIDSRKLAQSRIRNLDQETREQSAWN